MWVKDGLRVERLGRATWIEAGGAGLLVDAPAGIETVLGDRLSRLQAILLTSGRIEAIGGLLALLCALEPTRKGMPLSVYVPMGDDRAPSLTAVWGRGWPGRYPVMVDAFAPGQSVDMGELSLVTAALRAGEPRWSTASVEPVVAVALRVEGPSSSIGLVPSGLPAREVQRLLKNVDLLVAEVGVLPWPHADIRWRLSPSEALTLASGEVWLVGDDGRPVELGET